VIRYARRRAPVPTLRHFTAWPRGRLPYAAYAAALIIPSSFFLLAYPALFPADVDDPVIETDPAEGKAWLDSRIVIELRGNYTREQVLQTLEIDPPVSLPPGAVTVEQVAPLPWHESLPWAITRVTINQGHQTLFRQDTDYTLSLSGRKVEFETITVPEVTASLIEADEDGDRQDVPTNTRVLLYFNEQIEWHHDYLAVTPATEVRAEASLDDSGRTVVAISPVSRFENSTMYEFSVRPGIRDIHDHAGSKGHSTSFRTWARPTVLAATPEGITQRVDRPVTVTFERAVDRKSAEASFSLAPAAAGSFEWQGDTVMRWLPAARLPYSTAYSVRVAPIAAGSGDPYVPREWTFRTQDPPIHLELTGDLTGPTILAVKATGGLGSFKYEWSTGQKGHRVLVNVPHGETLPVELRVSSGDQVAVRKVNVSGPPYPTNYVAANCPAKWHQVEPGICYRQAEGPDSSDVFMARIDPRDPELQVRSALTADHLGSTRTLRDSAAAHGAVLATNGDFFHDAAPGISPVGPVITNGSVVRLDRRFDAAFTISRDGRAWAAGRSDTFLVLQGAAGPLNLYHVNSVPPKDEVAVYNSYWGPSLSLPFDACFATFDPITPDQLAPLDSQCGPVSGVPLSPGRLVIVGRGAAASWLEASAGSVVGIGDPLGLTTVQFMAGGSDALLQNGGLAPLSGAHAGPSPRTAVGVDAKGFLYLVVVDGRRAGSPGMSLSGLQAYLKGLGIVDAINLDGGGSSEMVLYNRIRNRPSDGKERPVTGAIEVVRPRAGCTSPLVRCE
jgi:hypothetical protein